MYAPTVKSAKEAKREPKLKAILLIKTECCEDNDKENAGTPKKGAEEK